MQEGDEEVRGYGKEEGGKGLGEVGLGKRVCGVEHAC